MAGNKQKKKRGRPLRHGGFSLIAKDELLKDQPHIRQYLLDCRAGLVRCVSGSEEMLTEQQRILIDRIISKLSICRLIEAYIEKYGIFRRDMLKKKVLELEPALGKSYLAYSNAIDRALVTLGIDKRKNEGVIDIHKYVAQRYGKKETTHEKSSVD